MWSLKTSTSGNYPKRYISLFPIVAICTATLVGLLTGCKSMGPVSKVNFPINDVKNFHGLVSVHWLKALMDYHASGQQKVRPLTYHNDQFVVLEASWGSLEKAKDYRKGHIPGAVHFNTDEFENGSPRWRLRALKELHSAIGQTGITSNTTVIVYSEQLIAAARIWWVLKYAGVDDVRMLDGGWRAWKKAGYEVEKEIQVPQAVEFSGKANTHWLATTEYVRDHLFDQEICLADVRSLKEYRGIKSGYSYIDAKGRIPSAVHLGDGDDSSFLYKHRNGHFKSQGEILELWRQGGIIPVEEGQFNKEVIFYCGGGWRSSVPFFYAWLLGFENIRNYSDGWSGWSTEYVQDPEVKGNVPGWRQLRTENPIVFSE